MKRTINKVKLFINDNDKSKIISLEVKEKLINHNFEIVEEDYDLAIAIGGDGSFLRMLKNNNFDSNIYYIGINTGTLGFLQEISPKEIDNFLDKLDKNEFKIDTIGIQETKIETDDSISRFYSLNDIVVRDKDLNATRINVYIDDTELEKFVGDGLLVATSVGSSAYNISFGGSIVYNTIHTLQITPIAPLNNRAYSNLFNSLIIPESKVITLIPENNKNNIVITIDGENNYYKSVKKIETVVNEKRINCLRMKDYKFIKIVNNKLLK